MESKDYPLLNDITSTPLAVCLEVYTERNTQADVVLKGDVYSPKLLQFEIVTEPEHGVLLDQDDHVITVFPVLLKRELIRYLPDRHFTGRDIFSYRVVSNANAVDSKVAVVVVCVFDAHRAEELYFPVFELNMEKILKWEFQKYEFQKGLAWETAEESAPVCV